MLLNVYQSAPPFPNGAPVSAIDLDTLRSNSLILYNAASNWSVPVQAFDRKSKQFYNKDDTWLYYGSFQYHSGMTTFRCEGAITVPNGHDTVKYYIGNQRDGNNNEVVPANLRRTEVFNPGTTGFAHEVDISALGYQEGDMVDITVTVSQSRTTGIPASTYQIFVYVYPLLLTGWPGVPTFSGTNALSSANLQQLSAASEWLANFMTLMPLHPTTATLLDTLSFGRGQNAGAPWNTPDESMWAGSVITANGKTRFQIGGKVTTRDARERYELHIDESGTISTAWPSKTTYSPIDTTSDWQLQWDFGNNETHTLRFGNQLDTTGGSGGYNDEPGNNHVGRSRHTIDYARLVPPTPITPPSGTITVEHVARVNLDYVSLLSKLNAIGTLLSQTKAIIDAAPLLFGRYYIIQPMMARRNEDFQFLQKTQLPRFVRVGERLWVRGRGVKVHYGPITIKHEKDVYEYSFLYEKEVTPGDKIMSTYVYLDTFEGLFRGLPYYVTGTELRTCFETMR